MRREYCAAMTERVDEALRSHLIRPDGDEDLAFALWSPSAGAQRLTALVRLSVVVGESVRVDEGAAVDSLADLYRLRYDATSASVSELPHSR